jgi:hypothetical protein
MGVTFARQMDQINGAITLARTAGTTWVSEIRPRAFSSQDDGWNFGSSGYSAQQLTLINVSSAINVS